MLAAYARWNAFRLLSQPRIQVAGRALVGLRKFGEYWNFNSTVPTAGEEKFLRRFLAGSSSPCIDVGSNIGQFAVFIASIAAGPVHCFEPHPLAFDGLKRNCTDPGFILNNIAISNNIGDVLFTDNGKSTHVNRIFVDDNSLASVIRVRCTTIDDYLSASGLDYIKFMKIDVEGAEPMVISGAKEILSRKAVGAMLIEISSENLANVGFNISDLLAETASVGYSPHALSDGGLLGPKLELRDLIGLKLSNFVFIPD